MVFFMIIFCGGKYPLSTQFYKQETANFISERELGSFAFVRKNKEEKNLIQHKLTSIVFLLTLILISSIYASLPTVQATAEPNIQDATVGILKDIVGIDVNSYQIASNQDMHNQSSDLKRRICLY